MIEIYEILTQWDSDDGITFHDPTDEDTWYNLATQIYHQSIKVGDDELYHEGRTKEESSNHIGSGRYPVGSGKDPFQHKESEFYKTYRRLCNAGFSQKEIADYFGYSIKDLRATVTLNKKEEIEWRQKTVFGLRDKGMSVDEINKATGIPIRTIYNTLNPKNSSKKESLDSIAGKIASELERKRFLDIGEGVETNLGISKERLAAAVKSITDTGEYEVMSNFKVDQPTNPGKRTTLKLLVPTGTTYKDVKDNLGDIKSMDDYVPMETEDGRRKNSFGIHDPIPIKESRVYIRYPDEGGKDRDGTIELRRGVDDISLGNSQYAQVRIATDKGNYLKGVALYTNDIPDGYDIVFNTNKPEGTPPEKVFKEMKPNKENPFGATINAQRGALNIVNEEGDWDDWSKSLSSQFLSKQPKEIIQKQLDLAYKEKEDEYNTIMSIDNSVIRKVLLKEFADSCDGASVDLKGAAIPGQSNKLILPCPSLKDNEVYAPTYENGTVVVLVRHPHAGTFELPRLVVNNKNKEAAERLGNSEDAIGINAHVAEQLSGADFDGDTVVVLPENRKIKFQTQPYLEGLKNFSTDQYPRPDSMVPVREQKNWKKQTQMGTISNLITDMTLRGATNEELVRAVKHSMVIIDAEKHNLWWEKSYEDNKIAELAKKYQGKASGGASTLISRAKGQASIPERKESYLESMIDPETGELHYKYSGRMMTKRVTDPETGLTTYEKTNKPAMEEVTKMEKAFIEGKDALALSSGHPKEIIYGNYANDLRKLANKARLSYLEASKNPYKKDPEAAKLYSEEVEKLLEKEMIAKKNAPRERQATILANIMIKADIDADPSLTDYGNKKELSKRKAQRMTGARAMVGASGSKTKVWFTQQEWEAIEANALSPSKLESLLSKSKTEYIMKMAMPKQSNTLSQAKIDLVKSMSASGYTMKEIAERLDVSVSTISRALHPHEKDGDA